MIYINPEDIANAEPTIIAYTNAVNNCDFS